MARAPLTPRGRPKVRRTARPPVPLIAWPEVHPSRLTVALPEKITCVVIFGAPRTKKNSRDHVRVRGKTVPLPSAAYREWVRDAGVYIAQPDGALHRWSVPPLQKARRARAALLPAGIEYNVCATFYRDAARGDACGYYQGLGDFLQARGLIANDVQCAAWDGSRLRVDRQLPRVIVALRPLDDLERDL